MLPINCYYYLMRKKSFTLGWCNTKIIHMYFVSVFMLIDTQDLFFFTPAPPPTTTHTRQWVSPRPIIFYIYEWLSTTVKKIKDLWWKLHSSAATLKLLTSGVCSTRQFQCGWIQHRCGTSAKTHPSKHPIRSPSPPGRWSSAGEIWAKAQTWPQSALNPNGAERYALNYDRRRCHSCSVEDLRATLRSSVSASPLCLTDTNWC